MKCIIIASGDLVATVQIREMLKSARLIICADGGARHLRALNVMPHVLIGDFDSILPDDQAYLARKQVRQLTFPVAKDQTDSELCVLHAVEQGATDITLLGVTGSRLDHTLANIFLLKRLAEQHIKARIIDSHNELYLVLDQMTLIGNPGDIVSIIPITEVVSGITLEGLEYSMKNGEIRMGSPIGISNRFVQKQAKIRVKTGGVLVIKSRD
jgi:thiamine pyrophosphokinase